MLSKWRARGAAIGAFFLAVITWLGFFGIDARTIWNKLSTHYVLLACALIFTSLFIVSLRYLWRVTRVTPENVHLKIRQWLDTFNVSHSVVPWEPWHFRYDATFWGQVFYIGRPKAGGGPVLYIELRTSVREDLAKAFDALPDFDQRQLKGQIALEIARARVPMVLHKEDYTDFSITRTLPITAKLNEMDFLNTVADVYYGAMLVWNSVGLRLDKGTAEVKPPLLSSDT